MPWGEGEAEEGTERFPLAERGPRSTPPSQSSGRESGKGGTAQRLNSRGRKERVYIPLRLHRHGSAEPESPQLGTWRCSGGKRQPPGAQWVRQGLGRRVTFQSRGNGAAPRGRVRSPRRAGARPRSQGLGSSAVPPTLLGGAVNGHCSVRPSPGRFSATRPQSLRSEGSGNAAASDIKLRREVPPGRPRRGDRQHKSGEWTETGDKMRVCASLREECRASVPDSVLGGRHFHPSRACAYPPERATRIHPKG